MRPKPRPEADRKAAAERPDRRSHDAFAAQGELRYTGFTPMNRSEVIDPETKSRGATPS